MKQPIVQKHNFSCGLACLSFLINQSYNNLVSKFGLKKAQTKGFYCREIVEYLSKEDYRAEYHYLNKKWRRRIYSEGTIVFVRRGKKYPFGHYLIRYQNQWMDPWINFLKNKKIDNAVAGFRKRLPEKPIYGIFVNNKKLFQKK